MQIAHYEALAALLARLEGGEREALAALVNERAEMCAVLTGTQTSAAALYAAVNARRIERGQSWRAVGREIGCSPSTLTRYGQGHAPNLETGLALLRWLYRTGKFR